MLNGIGLSIGVILFILSRYNYYLAGKDIEHFVPAIIFDVVGIMLIIVAIMSEYVW